MKPFITMSLKNPAGAAELSKLEDQPHCEPIQFIQICIAPPGARGGVS